MIQLVVNSNLLREIDEGLLIRRYAKFYYNDNESIENDALIKQNLKNLLDWDKNNSIPIFCSKFESIKRRDITRLINFIKENGPEIVRTYNAQYKNKKKREEVSFIKDYLKVKEQKIAENYLNPNYKVSGRGKKAKPCTYKDRTYLSRSECQYKEGITKGQLYKYLKETNQL